MRVPVQSIGVRSVVGVARVPGAAEALARLFAQRQTAPFQWGAHDCCLWAADAIFAQVGKDPAADLRGRYRTALQAERVIAACGGSLQAIATGALGDPLRHAMHACAGDVGLVECNAQDEPARYALAVCVGEWWAAPSSNCMSLRPLHSALVSWRVGCA